MFPDAAGLKRRQVLKRGVGLGVGALALPAVRAAHADDGDPYKTHTWPDIRREFLGASGQAVFDPRVQVRGPVTAENPMVVPISLAVAPELGEVERVLVLVDRNPIRKVLDFEPQRGARAAMSLRFKLEQASPVRAAVLTRAGRWHIGGCWVDSAGGGCTVSGATRQDGSWAQTLGQVSGKLFPDAESGGARLRLRVMHPMDTGLVGGIPAFYVNKLSLQDGSGRELMRMNAFEPVSENPVFSFDFKDRPAGALRLVGSDNNGNRIQGSVE